MMRLNFRKLERMMAEGSRTLDAWLERGFSWQVLHKVSPIGRKSSARLPLKMQYAPGNLAERRAIAAARRAWP